MRKIREKSKRKNAYICICAYNACVCVYQYVIIIITTMNNSWFSYYMVDDLFKNNDISRAIYATWSTIFLPRAVV